MKRTNSNQMHHKVAYVFQGGGSLGTFQVGAYDALAAADYHPDMLVGISIGSINAAIIAGNKPEYRSEKLHHFWNKIATRIPRQMLSLFGMEKFYHTMSANHALLVGQPGFFTPRPYHPSLLIEAKPDQLSFYDTTPLKETLEELIDFDYLNNHGPRLCLGSVDLESGDFVFFDSQKETITPLHVMASGALPPGFPPVELNGRYYVDGGVFSNTPLSQVIDEFAKSDNQIEHILCFMVDLFSASGALPHSFDGLLERVKDIQYSSHSKRANHLYATTQNLSHAINFLASKLTAEQLQDPEIQEVIKLGFAHRLDIVRIIYHSKKGTELSSKDYEFSTESAEKHWSMGYHQTKQLIHEEESTWKKSHESGVTIYRMTDKNKGMSLKL